MAELYYEDVQEGMELPTLRKDPTTQQLVKWAGASGDYAQIHTDKDVAIKSGFRDGVILHGKLKFAFLGQLITDWVGPRGRVKAMSCQYRAQDRPGNVVTIKGKVTKKHVQDGEHIVECEMWTENPQGEKTTPGNAVVVLPSRAAPSVKGW